VEAQINGFRNEEFVGIRIRSLAKPLSGQTWDWPKYTGSMFDHVDDNDDRAMRVPLFTDQEWQDFAFMDEREVLESFDFRAAEGVKWGKGLAAVPYRATTLRTPWSPNGRNRRDYDPAYGRHILLGGDDCTHSRGERMFIRQGWGRWTIVEYNDGQG